MTSAFISYSRKDQAVATSIAKELEVAGHDVWIDTSEIMAGAKWRNSLVEGIKSQTAFIILLSPNSVASHEVERELSIAASDSKSIIPIFIAPVIIRGMFKYSLSQIQFLDYVADPKKCISDLLQKLAQLDATIDLGSGELVDSLINTQSRVFTFWIERLINSNHDGNKSVTFEAQGNPDPLIRLSRNTDGSISFFTQSQQLLPGTVTDEQSQTLSQLGWRFDKSTYSQLMFIHDDKALSKAADLILLTFMIIYGVNPNESVVVRHENV